MTAFEYIQYLQRKLRTTNVTFRLCERFDDDAILIDKLQNENANQIRMRCDMQRKFDDLQNLCTEQKAEIERLTEEKNELLDELIDKRGKMDKAQQEVYIYQDKNAELQMQVDELAEENHKLCNEWENTTQFSRTLRNENDKLDNELRLYKDAHESIKRNAAELQKQVDELTKENERLKKFELYRIKKIDEQKARIERLTEERNRFENDHFAVRISLRQAITENEHLLEELKNCGQELIESYREREELQDRTTDLQQQVDELRRALVGLHFDYDPHIKFDDRKPACEEEVE